MKWRMSKWSTKLVSILGMIRDLEEQVAALKEQKQREEKDGKGKASGEGHRGS